MPKKLFPIVRFEGGVNSKSDARDIEKNSTFLEILVRAL